MRLEVTQQELNEWLKYCKQIKNGYHMSDSDVTELLQLNHKVMEVCHDVHNSSMMNMLRKK